MRVMRMTQNNINTDQIIPGEFLNHLDWASIGKGLFHGEVAASIPADGEWALLSGDNFGCGSSREQAVWALLARGCRAVVAPSFARIFRRNAVYCGLVVAPIGEDDWKQLQAMGSVAQIHIHMDSQQVEVIDSQETGTRFAFALTPFEQYVLEHGGWLQVAMSA